jgi:hypothetical protein
VNEKKYEMKTLFSTWTPATTDEQKRAESEMDNRIMSAFERGAVVHHHSEEQGLFVTIDVHANKMPPGFSEPDLDALSQEHYDTRRFPELGLDAMPSLWARIRRMFK